MGVTKITMLNMGITAAVSIILPFALLLMWKKRNRQIKSKPFLAGAAAFVIFALILESMCHQIFLAGNTPLSVFINDNIWAYVMYGALAAGIFEETGRFVTFKFFLKNNNAKEDAVTYGIGHGAVESVILVGFSMLSSMMMMYTITKMGGVESYVALVPAESQDMLRESLNAMFATEPYVYLLAGVERVATIFFHIALSVFVFIAAKRPGKWYFYPAAILIHTFLDVFAVLYQRGVITNIIITEAVIVAISLATVFLAYCLYRKDTGEAGEEAV